MNKVLEKIEFKTPIKDKFDKDGNQMYYENSFYCQTNYNIHSNLKSALRCNHCTPTLDKIEYEASKRLEFLINGYFIHSLGSRFSKITTERLCELYNIKLNYFRPWL
jgi:hypothetical protein